MNELNASAIYLFRQYDRVLKNNKLNFTFQRIYDNNVFA